MSDSVPFHSFVRPEDAVDPSLGGPRRCANRLDIRGGHASSDPDGWTACERLMVADRFIRARPKKKKCFKITVAHVTVVLLLGIRKMSVMKKGTQ